MFDFDKNITDNLAYFNDQEPDDEHKERFAAKLDEKPVIRNRRFNVGLISSIAASLIILISISYLVYNQQELMDNNIQYITQIEYTDDFLTIQDYYDDLSNEKLLEIDEFAKDKEEASRLKSKAKKKMDKLDESLAMIEKEYVKNPQCKKLKDAIISNKKMKVDVVNNIVEQLDNAQQGYHAGSMYTNF